MRPFSERHIPQLDGIRGLAIALILVHHYVGPVDATLPGTLAHALCAAAERLWVGVDLFFVLSGFLVGGIVLDRIDAPRFARTFYGRRALRILPLYALLIVGLLAARALADVGVFDRAWSEPLLAGSVPLKAYLTFTQNWVFVARDTFGPYWLSPTWSLAIEEQFYLTLPLLLAWVPRRWRIAALAAPVVLAPAFRYYVTIAQPSSFTLADYVLFPARADALFLGVLLAEIVRRVEFERITPALRRHVRLVALTLALFVPGLLIVQPQTDPGSVVWGYTIFAGLSGVLILQAVWWPGSWAGRALELAPLRWLGRHAYGLYLFHVPVLWLSFGRHWSRPPYFGDLSSAAMALAALTVTLGLSYFSLKYFEAPITRLGRKLRYDAGVSTSASVAQRSAALT